MSSVSLLHAVGRSSAPNWIVAVESSGFSVKSVVVDNSGYTHIIVGTGTSIFYLRYNVKGVLGTRRILDVASITDTPIDAICLNDGVTAYIAGHTVVSTFTAPFLLNSTGTSARSIGPSGLAHAQCGGVAITPNKAFILMVSNYPNYGSTTSKIVKYNTSTLQTSSSYGLGAPTGGINCSTIAIDSAENMYIAGAYKASTITIPFLCKITASGSLQWCKTVGTSTLNSIINGVVVDSLLNVYIVGQDSNAAATSKAFLIKYDKNGTQVWQRVVDVASTLDTFTKISIDYDDNIYIAGTSNNVPYVFKFTTGGTCLYQKKFTATNGGSASNLSSVCLATDTFGNFYVSFSASGVYASVVTLKLPGDGITPKTGTYTIANTVVTYSAGSLAIATTGIADATVSTFTAYANTVGSNSFMNTANLTTPTAGNLAKDSTNKLLATYLTGTSVMDVYLSTPYSSTAASSFAVTESSPLAKTTPKVFLDSSNNRYLTASTGGNGFILKHANNTTTTITWQKGFKGGTPQAIAFDSLGNIYAVFATGTYGVLIKLDSTGTLLLEAGLKGSGNSGLYDIAIDASNNIYVTGFVITATLSDLLLAKYNTSLSLIWQKQYTATTASVGSAMKLNNAGEICIVGTINAVSYILKCDTAGSIIWKVQLTGSAAIAIDIDSSDNIYGVTSSNAYKFDTNGNLIWQVSSSITPVQDILVNNTNTFSLLLNNYIVGRNLADPAICGNGTGSTFNNPIILSKSAYVTSIPTITDTAVTAISSLYDQGFAISLGTATASGSFLEFCTDSSDSIFIHSGGTKLLKVLKDGSVGGGTTTSYYRAATYFGVGIGVDSSGAIYSGKSENNGWSVPMSSVVKWTSAFAKTSEGNMTSGLSNSSAMGAYVTGLVVVGSYVYISGLMVGRNTSPNRYSTYIGRYSTSNVLGGVSNAFTYDGFDYLRVKSDGVDIYAVTITDPAINGTITTGILVKTTLSLIKTWMVEFTSTTAMNIKDLHVDSSGNSFIVGQITVGTRFDLLVMKYDTSGALVWVKTLAGSAESCGNGIITDNNGDIFVTGFTTIGTKKEFILVKLNSAGDTILWQKRFSTAVAFNGAGHRISIDTSGNIVMSGYLNTNASSSRAVIIKVPPSLNFLTQSLGTLTTLQYVSTTAISLTLGTVSITSATSAKTNTAPVSVVGQNNYSTSTTVITLPTSFETGILAPIAPTGTSLVGSNSGGAAYTLSGNFTTDVSVTFAVTNPTTPASYTTNL
jgi:hypothetical protein